MALNTKALTLTGAILWGGCFLLVGLGNLLIPPYGDAWLQVGASVYPGYHGPGGFGSVIVVTLYAALDGAICGLVIGWLYNTLAASRAAGA